MPFGLGNLGSIAESVKGALDAVKSSNGMGCYFHPEEQSVAQCMKCGKGICRSCVDRYSKTGDKYAGLCRDCVLQAGIECKDHPSKQAVAFCAKCGNAFCKDCSEDYGVKVGEYAGHTLCHECTTGIEKDEQDTFKFNIWQEERKKKTLLICSAICGGLSALIGMVLGVKLSMSRDIVEIMGFVIGGMWLGTGIGIAVSDVPDNFRFFKYTMREEGFEVAIKDTFGLFEILGFFGCLFAGPIALLVRVLKINHRIKKLKRGEKVKYMADPCGLFAENH